MHVTSKISHFPTLKAGDAVALIAPASGQKNDQQHLIDQALILLKKWGLHVICQPSLDTKNYLSADDPTRAQELKTALTHPKIKAIFTTRGGYGCARILPYLSGIKIPSPRLLIGFSDITTLHLHFATEANIHSIHGPNLATLQFLSDCHNGEKNRRALKQLLFQGSAPALNLQPLTLQQTNKSIDEKSPKITEPVTLAADAKLTGGCLSLLVTSLGTQHEIDCKGKLLLIEEIGETPYKIDRMLTHLINAGKIQQLAGIIVGDMVNCHTPTITPYSIIHELITHIAKIPIYHTQEVGHGRLNYPWVYGTQLTLNAKNTTM